MGMRIQRSISEPIRPEMTWDERWRGPDAGLIACWERGRQRRAEDPDAAAAAQRGELPVLFIPAPWNPKEKMVVGWKGGVTKKLKIPLKENGTLRYLAEWQGVRGDDLDIDLEEQRVLICSKTGQAVLFSGIISLGDTEEGAEDIDSTAGAVQDQAPPLDAS
jgi:hypothetical protein